jgi:Icc-related predicted phosphoesterase
MKITCVADLHGHYPKLPGGDLLIVAGDLTAGDGLEQWEQFNAWLSGAKYECVVVIGGNHDNRLQQEPDLLAGELSAAITYLCDSGTIFAGLHIWGSPWTRRFDGENPDCLAFTCDTDDQLAAKWACIPEDTNILITHCPPWGLGDAVEEGDKLLSVGSRSLLKRIEQLKSLRLCVFGHIHEGYGIWSGADGPQLVNASHMDGRYRPVNAPIEVEVQCNALDATTRATEMNDSL